MSAGATRVVIDVRPLQERDRTPITAAYLERLLAAFAADPRPGESFVVLLRALRPDPTQEATLAGLPVAGRRRLPPTARVFRNAGLTLDAFLLRGAEVRTSAGARESGALGAVYHTAGGAVPLASGLPVVATLLDLAPWELPERYAATTAARFGHRLRARTLRDAARVIVASRATATAAERLLHLDPARIVVIPLAADPAVTAWADRESDADAGDGAADGAAGSARLAALRDRFDLPERYLVFAGRYDARKDFRSLFAALAALRQEAPKGDGPWPPVVVLAGAAGDEHADSPLVARAARRAEVDDLVRLTPSLPPAELAALQRGAVAHVQPALSDGTGIAAVEALALGIPVIATRAGALPEIVGSAGIIVEPHEPTRLAAAIRTIWEGGSVARQVTARARSRARGRQRTWADVAAETRAAYAAAVEAGDAARLSGDRPEDAG